MQTFRDHKSILSEAGGVATVRRKLAELFPDLTDPTVRSWDSRNSIPAPYWRAIADSGMASLDELALAVARPVSGEASDLMPPSSQNDAVQDTDIAVQKVGHGIGELHTQDSTGGAA